MSLLAGAGVLASALSACNDQRGGSTASGSDSAGADTVSVEVPAVSLAYMDVFVARGAGYFEDEGLDIEWLPNIPNTTQAVQTVISGDADIAVAGSQGLFAGVAADRPLVGVGLSAVPPTVLVVVTSETAADFEDEGITPDSPIEDRVAALEGLPIATTGAGGSVEQMMRAAFEDFGIEPSSDNFRAFADQGAAVAAFREGQVPVFVGSPPASYTPVAEGEAEILISGPEAEIPSWAGSYYLSYLTSHSYLEDEGPAVEAFLRALGRAVDLIQSDPDAAKEAAQEFFPELDAELYDATFDLLRPAFSLDPPDEEGFLRTLELYNAGAPPELRIEDAPEFEDIYDLSALDTALSSL